MSANNDDGIDAPAFPRNYLAGGHNGMTLRDYFAAKADIGNVDEITPQTGEALLGTKCPLWQDDVRGCLEWWALARSTMRYIEADAMLKARKTGGPA